MYDVLNDVPAIRWSLTGSYSLHKKKKKREKRCICLSVPNTSNVDEAIGYRQTGCKYMTSIYDRLILEPLLESFGFVMVS